MLVWGTVLPVLGTHRHTYMHHISDKINLSFFRKFLTCHEWVLWQPYLQALWVWFLGLWVRWVWITHQHTLWTSCLWRILSKRRGQVEIGFWVGNICSDFCQWIWTI